MAEFESAEATACHVVGQARGKFFPRFPFPHAPAGRKSRASRARVQSRNVNAAARWAAVSTSSNDNPAVESTFSQVPSHSGLKKRHVAVLTSLLHRYIFQKDYFRAGRAMGLLLRVEHNGHAMDIRAHNRWGLGAEILLFSRAHPAAVAFSKDNSLLEEMNAHLPLSLSHEDEAGLRRAKDYYDRLLLHYPCRKFSSLDTIEMKFYTVTFVLWIFSIQARYKSSIKNFDSLARDSARISNRDDFPSEGGSKGIAARLPKLGNVQATDNALRDSREVIAQLDGLLLSPPHSDDPNLWRIQGMLFLWISHLIMDSFTSSQSSGRKNASTTRNWEEQDRQLEYDETLKRAKESFQKASILGARIEISNIQETEAGQF